MSYTIRKFQPETDVIKPFDCGVADLNGFLLESDPDTPNATLYDKEFLADVSMFRTFHPVLIHKPKIEIGFMI